MERKNVEKKNRYFLKKLETMSKDDLENLQ